VLRRVPDLPDAAVSWLDQLMRGKLVVHVDTKDVTEHVDRLGTTVTRLAAGMIMAGMLVGAAIVTSQIWQFGGSQSALPHAAMVVFVVLLLVGSRLIWRMLHPPRRPYVE
jgi:hypothetical protein